MAMIRREGARNPARSGRDVPACARCACDRQCRQLRSRRLVGNGHSHATGGCRHLPRSLDNSPQQPWPSARIRIGRADWPARDVVGDHRSWPVAGGGSPW